MNLAAGAELVKKTKIVLALLRKLYESHGMNTTDSTVQAKPLAKFQHHAEYATMDEMRKAAALAGFSEITDKGRTVRFEKPPGICPDHNNNFVWWTQKMSFSHCGGFGEPLVYLMYSH